MNKKTTDITMILDRSSSMQAMQEDAISSFNNFVEEQKNTAGDASFTLVQFNHLVRRCFAAIPVENVQKIDNENYVPAGYTALLDAVGRTIIENKQRLNKQGDRSVVIVVLTDGMENASQAFTPPMVRDLIKECESELGWNFIFLAADPDSFSQYQQFGFDGEKSLMAGRGRAAYRHAMSLASHKIKQMREDDDESRLLFSKCEREVARNLDQEKNH